MRTPAPRRLEGPFGWLAGGAAAMFAGFYLYTSGFGVLSVQSHRSVYVGVTIALIFLWFPARATASPKSRFSVVDVLLALAALLSVGYFNLNFVEIASPRPLGPPAYELFFSGSIIFLSLEAGRRTLGPILPGLAAVMLVYSMQWVSPLLPDLLYHPGFRPTRIATHLYASLSGIFGQVAGVYASILFVFVILGAFLKSAGVGDFIVDVSRALFRRSAGGAAKVSVVTSAGFGSINGSTVANTVTTGTFTIPLMIRSGFKPHVAAGIEPAASTGGSFLPPIMGGVAFLMAEFAGISYARIMQLALVPALLFFLGVFVMVHLEAKKQDIRSWAATNSEEAAGDDGAAPVDHLPSVARLVIDGWLLAAPVVVLVWLIVIEGRTPSFAAFWSVVATIAVTYVRRQFVMTPRRILETVIEAVRSSLFVGAVVGAIGIILGTLGLTGLGVNVSRIMVALSGESIVLLIVLTFVAALILGLGMPITASYLVLLALVMPAFSGLGLSTEQSHFTLIWYTQLSAVTPPVCLAAFASAAIARCDPYAAGVQAIKFSAPLLIAPFLFIYTPLLGLEELSPVGVAGVVVALSAGTVTFGAVMQRWLVGRTQLWEWTALVVATVLLLSAAPLPATAGALVTAAVIAAQLARRRAMKQPPLDQVAGGDAADVDPPRSGEGAPEPVQTATSAIERVRLLRLRR